MKLLTFTTLYPSIARPRHGIFVESRLLQLRSRSNVEAEVIAPVPWFPSTSPRFGDYATFAKTPRSEMRSGIKVHHPRYLMVPQIGMNIQPFSLARAAIRQARLLQRSGADWDLIDAHYCYPDGVAAALLARRIGKPVVITARGSDVNLLLDFAVPRRLILWAVRQAQAMITVSAALKEKLVACGVPPGHITVLRNGVDLDIFRPLDRQASRSRLGLPDAPLMISVGNLVPEKGHDVVLEALAELPDMRLAIVGEGPQRSHLEALAARIGVSGRVSFLPVRPQSELSSVYSAADVLALCSVREGWPNVLLESMACGTPVVACDVGGVREIVRERSAGQIVGERTGAAVARCVRNLMAECPSRDATRRFAEQFSWTSTSKGQLALFATALETFNGRAAATA